MLQRRSGATTLLNTKGRTSSARRKNRKEGLDAYTASASDHPPLFNTRPAFADISSAGSTAISIAGLVLVLVIVLVLVVVLVAVVWAGALQSKGAAS